MPPQPLPSAAQKRLHEMLAPLVDAAGYDLEEVTVTAAGRRSVVRVIVDADGGIDLDSVAAVSRVINDALDAQTPDGPAFAGAYVLEVSSPGVDRPLTEPRHWRRNIGRLVEVSPATLGGPKVTGRVSAVSDAGVTLLVEGAERDYGWDELGTGRVQIEFNRSDDADVVDESDDFDGSAEADENELFDEAELAGADDVLEEGE
jgi:ribosome maturation factor RimP